MPSPGTPLTCIRSAPANRSIRPSRANHFSREGKQHNEMSNESNLADLDLAIPDMDSTAAQSQVATLLKDIPGIAEVRTIERGAFIRYRAAAISHEQICALLQRAGFRASTFQDSESGKTGQSSQ
jgi:hypothetical protein